MLALPAVLTVAMVAAVPVTSAAAAAAVKPVCPAEVADENAALVTARMCGGPVAIAGLTTQTDQAVATATGTVQWQHHYRPVRVRQGASWAPVDTTLITRADGRITPTAAAVDLTFSGGGTAPMVSVVAGATSFIVGSPVGALPKPVLDGNVATYPSVLPGVDLQLRADVDGYAQVLVVKTRAAAANPKLARLVFAVAGKGVTTSADPAGNLRVKDSKGALVLAGNTPLMWDAPTEAADPKAAAGRSVAMAATVSGGALTVTPNAAMLTDATTVYPVYIDPGVTLNRSSWAQVDSATATTAYWNGTGDAQVGTSNAGTSKKRAFFNVDLAATPVVGKYVSAATLDLAETSSASCATRQVDLYATGAATSSTTWNVQPTWGALQSSQTVAKGFDATCPAGPVSMDATAGVRTAVTAGASTITLGVRSPNETDNTYAKAFSNNPTLTVSYTAYPSVVEGLTTPSTPCTTGSGRPYLNTLTPLLQARITDPEGALVRPEFAWSTSTGTSIGGATPTPGQASGQMQATTVPAGAFANGGSYSWKVRGFDGTVWGPWSPSCEFTVDTTVPTTTPTVSSTTYPANTWAGATGTAGTFTLGANGTTDTAAYLYGLDTEPSTVINAPTLGANATISITPTADGTHTLKVQGRDRGGNLSPVTSYTFNVGTGAVTAPVTGAQTAGKVTLSGISKTTSSGVTYQWRRADVDTWTTIPAGDVTTTTGGAITWPVATSGSGAYPNLVWNVAQTLNNAETGSNPLDGPVQVRVSLSGTSTGVSTGVLFTLDRNSTEAASMEVGPGSVNLLTGNYTVDVSDAATIGGLSLQRSFNTRRASDVDPMFGPGWTSSIDVPDAGTYTELTVTGSLVQIGLGDGTTAGFTKTTTTSSGATFSAAVGIVAALTYTTAGDVYNLTDQAGNVVTFSRRSGDPAGLYTPTAMQAGGATATGSSISWETVTIGSVAVVRPTRVDAPVPAGVSSCASLVKGCRALTFTYATATTATASTLGDYAGRLRQVALTAYDPDLATPAMRTVPLAMYSYDNNGRLRNSWDPRLDYINGGTTTSMIKAYAYNADGTLASLTPPGEPAWQLTYTTLPVDSGSGRLYKVTRSALSAGTSVQTIVYNMPVSGSNAPVDMAATVNRWGQTSAPVDATAVYPGDVVPDGNPPTGQLPTNTTDDRDTVVYMDTNGRQTNTMQPGGGVNATFYDAYGNIIRDLTAGNIARTLYASATDTAAQEAALSRTLSTDKVYSADGQRLMETLQPEQDTVLTDWGTVRGRTHNVFAYDEGATGTGPYNVVTTATESVQYVISGATVNVDQRKSTHQYDWNLRSQTATTVDPSGLALTTRAGYDTTTGQVTSTTTTDGNAGGTTPATRKTVYYRAGTGSAFSECDNHAEWALLPCRVYAAANPNAGSEIPYSVTTYDIYGQPRVVTDNTSSATLRTATETYDTAGRLTDIDVSATTGTAVSKRHTVYQPATGYVTSRQSVDSSGNVTAAIASVYDTLGRPTSYTDADGSMSTATYDLMSRPTSVNDGKATQTISYNGGSEKRGLPTQLDDAQAGAFTATYDLDGNIATESRPDGITVNHYYNENGRATGLEYLTSPTCNTASCTLYYDYTGSDTHRKTRWDSSTFSDGGYGYDNAGRLTGVRQDTASGCALRSYTFDNASNRIALSTYGPDNAGACQDSNPAVSRSWVYDNANRVTNSGYTYDAHGRTLTVPAVDTPGGSSAGAAILTYHTNDMVRTITQGATQATYTLDVLTARFRSFSSTVGSTTVNHINHYINDSDSPAWTDDGASYTRPVSGIGGLAAIYSQASGALEWQFTNLHGDVVATRLGTATGLSSTFVTDEYGQQQSAAQRYGFLGDAQRSGDNPAGLILMGVRVYNRALGRFLQADPIWGGSANRYDYANQDPINGSDNAGLDSGTCTCGRVSIWGPQYGYKKISEEYYGQTGWISANLSWLLKAANDYNQAYEYLSGWYQTRYKDELWYHFTIHSRTVYKAARTVKLVISVYKYHQYYEQQHNRYRVRVKYIGYEFYLYSLWWNIDAFGGTDVEYFQRYETVWRDY